MVDKNNHRVQKFDPNGVFLTKWGSLGTAPGDFDHPCGLVATPSGEIFVIDQRNFRIEVFGPPPVGVAAQLEAASWGRIKASFR